MLYYATNLVLIYRCQMVTYTVITGHTVVRILVVDQRVVIEMASGITCVVYVVIKETVQ